jgi:hypothetical protein
VGRGEAGRGGRAAAAEGTSAAALERALQRTPPPPPLALCGGVGLVPQRLVTRTTRERWLHGAALLRRHGVGGGRHREEAGWSMQEILRAWAAHTRTVRDQHRPWWREPRTRFSGVVTLESGAELLAAAGGPGGAEKVPGQDCNIIEAPWLVNGGHGASLRHHNQPHLLRGGQPPAAAAVRWGWRSAAAPAQRLPPRAVPHPRAPNMEPLPRTRSKLEERFDVSMMRIGGAKVEAAAADAESGAACESWSASAAVVASQSAKLERGELSCIQQVKTRLLCPDELAMVTLSDVPSDGRVVGVEIVHGAGAGGLGVSFGLSPTPYRWSEAMTADGQALVLLGVQAGSVASLRPLLCQDPVQPMVLVELDEQRASTRTAAELLSRLAAAGSAAPGSADEGITMKLLDVRPRPSRKPAADASKPLTPLGGRIAQRLAGALADIEAEAAETEAAAATTLQRATRARARRRRTHPNLTVEVEVGSPDRSNARQSRPRLPSRTRLPPSEAPYDPIWGISDDGVRRTISAAYRGDADGSAAARKLQAVARGRALRKQLAAEKHEWLCHAAATVIQARVRANRQVRY